MHRGYRQSERGQAVITAVLLFVVGSLAVMAGVHRPVNERIEAVNTLRVSSQSYFASESGVEDVAFRLMTGLPVDASETISVNAALATTTTAAGSAGIEVVALGSGRFLERKNKLVLEEGSGALFHYGLQSDAGGISMVNSSSVRGNIYSNGPITGTNSNLTRGDVISAGPSGLIDGIHATGSAYAHTIRDSDIDGDAHYDTISNSSVGGTLYPGSPDQATSTLPISDAMIDEWEAAAEAGGVVTSPCPYNIPSGSVTLGPVKINCDLSISGSSVVTLAGAVWVVGNISMSNSATMRIASSVGNKSVPVIADNPSNRSSGSRISLSNSAEFSGNGDKSFVLLLSRNQSAKLGGGTTAISISNSVAGDLILYAGEGLITLSNSVELAEVTGWKLRLSNTAEVIYRQGLASLLFSAGPSGGYTIKSWEEIE